MKHYLHIAFQGTMRDGVLTVSSFSCDMLVVVENCTLGQLRQYCMNTCAAEGLIFEGEPTITSIDELSEELFNILCGDKPYNVLNLKEATS